MVKTSTDHIDIPVIDISPSNPNAAKELLDAAVQLGFVFIANDDSIIPSHMISQVFGLSKEFFSLPTETKEKVSISSNKAGENTGWLSQGVEKLDPATQKRPDVKEAFNMSLPDPQTNTIKQPLPDLFKQHQSLLIDFQKSCHALCQRILHLFALALQVDDPNWFTSRHDLSQGKPCSAISRFLYYPHVSTSETDEHDIRAGAHSDYGSVTCLFQLPGQPGLEIRRPSDGVWAPVPVDPEKKKTKTGGKLPILVNFGDLLEDWTGGLLKSTVHRVVFPSGSEEGEKEGKAGDRYSIAYFCHPLDEVLLEPVPSRMVEEYILEQHHQKKLGRNGTGTGTGTGTGAGGKVISARDHLMERLAATYHIK